MQQEATPMTLKQMPGISKTRLKRPLEMRSYGTIARPSLAFALLAISIGISTLDPACFTQFKLLHHRDLPFTNLITHL